MVLDFMCRIFKKEEEEELSETMKAFRETVEHLEFQGKITLEIGRYLAADCGIYVTRIGDVKEMQDKYGIVDGGYPSSELFWADDGDENSPLCTVGRGVAGREKREKRKSSYNLRSFVYRQRCIGKNLSLKGSYLGNVLVLLVTGAYSVTEGIYLFLSRNFPRVSFSREQGVTLVRDEIASSQFNGGSQF